MMINLLSLSWVEVLILVAGLLFECRRSSSSCASLALSSLFEPVLGASLFWESSPQEVLLVVTIAKLPLTTPTQS